MCTAIVELNNKEAKYALAGLANLIRTETPDHVVKDVKAVMIRILSDIYLKDESITEKHNSLNTYVVLSGFNSK